MLFNLRGANVLKEEKVKNQLKIDEILAFRDTWTNIPEPGFSLEGVLLRSRLEKQRKAEVPKLVMSENGFRVRDKKDMDESELELRRLQSTLNKLTDKNFDAVVKEALSPDLVLNPVVLKGAVDIIFGKAMAEPVFSGIYAQLCHRINVYEQELVAEAEANQNSELARRLAAVQAEDAKQQKSASNGRVRLALILRCQEFHDNFVSQPPHADEESGAQLRKRNMANIKFVGELYMRALISHAVILAVCSTALVLNFFSSAKVVTTDADLEMVVSLMNVIGKRFDENAPIALQNIQKDVCNGEHPHDAIWRTLKACLNDPRYSIRIRFLIQNLLEWRSEGWKVKETANTTGAGTTSASSSGNANNSSNNNNAGDDGDRGYRGNSGGHNMKSNNQWHGNNRSAGAGGNNNTSSSGGNSASVGSSNAMYNQGSSYNNRGMPRSASMTDGSERQDKYGRGGRPDRVGSYHDLPQGAVHGEGSSPPSAPYCPPPPFPLDNAGALPPASGGAALSEDDRKMMALALPPACVDSTLSGKILSCIRDAFTDGDWAAAGRVIVEEVPEDAAYMCRMCAVYVIAKKITETPLEEDRQLFLGSLNSGIFDAKELSRGYAWCLTNAIANNIKEDYPKVYARFVNSLVATKPMDFISVVQNVMARTANYLDALYLPLEGEEMGWEEDFLEVWSMVVTQWREAHPSAKVGGGAILSCIATVKQHPFMQDVTPDFIMELMQGNFVSDEEMSQWLAESRNNEKYKNFAEQMEQLFPDL